MLKGNRGFTLLEGAIAIVIIGLVIGGIIVARSMITAAEQKDFVRQVAQYDIALEQFETKYKGIPGDTNRISPAGDNDLQIESSGTPNSGAVFSGEVANFWAHLYAVAGIKSQLGYTATLTGNIKVEGTSAGMPNIPAAKMAAVKGAGIIATHDNGGLNVLGAQNSFLMGKLDTNDGSDLSFSAIGDAFRPSDILAIETKIDNSNAQTGFVVAASQSGDCFVSGDDTKYDTSVSDAACSVAVKYMRSTSARNIATGPAVCGDGVISGGEQCDDSNTSNGDGCDSSCNTEGAAVCGNNVLEAGELCDDGGTSNGDGCDSSCQTEGSVCGNGVIEGIEVCDDGNTSGGDACDNSCGSADLCYGSACNASNCESCNPSNGQCESVCYGAQSCYSGACIECGNNNIEGTEQCDDGNLIAGDGCDSSCNVEMGGGDVCGDWSVTGPELCDDGNTNSGDGCDSSCQSESDCGCGYGASCYSDPGWCSAVSGSWDQCANTCSGYTTPEDYCSSQACYMGSCVWNGSACVDSGGGDICGDWSVTGSEQCDDGNTMSGDGCDSSCQTEGYDCGCGMGMTCYNDPGGCSGNGNWDMCNNTCGCYSGSWNGSVCDSGVSCGNLICEGGEDSGNCPGDCGGGDVCGDAICTGSEDTINCCTDCGTSAADNTCNCGEDCNSDPGACGPCASCGNTVCESGEDQSGCPYDCGGSCGDAYCNSSYYGGIEDSGNCPSDCGGGNCGNPDPGWCSGNGFGGSWDGCSSQCNGYNDYSAMCQAWGYGTCDDYCAAYSGGSFDYYSGCTY